MHTHHQRNRKTLKTIANGTLFGGEALWLRAIARMARRFLVAVVCAMALAPAANAVYEQSLDLLIDKLSLYLNEWRLKNPGRMLAMPLDEYHIATMAHALDRFFIKADRENPAIPLTIYNQIRILSYLADIFSEAFSEQGRTSYSSRFNGLFWDALFDRIPELLLNPLWWPQPQQPVLGPVPQPGIIPVFQPQVVAMFPQGQGLPAVPGLPVVPATAVPRPPAVQEFPPAPPVQEPPSAPPPSNQALEEAFQRGVAISQQEIEKIKNELEKVETKLQVVVDKLKQEQAGETRSSTDKRKKVRRSDGAQQQRDKPQGFVITEPGEDEKDAWPDLPALPSLAGIVPPTPPLTTTLRVTLDPASQAIKPGGRKRAADTQRPSQPPREQSTKMSQQQVSSRAPDNQPLKPDTTEAEGLEAPALAPKIAGGTAGAARTAKEIKKIFSRKQHPGRFKRMRSVLMLPATLVAAVGVAGWYVYNYLFAANSDVGASKLKNKYKKAAKGQGGKSLVACESDFKNGIIIAFCKHAKEQGTLEGRINLMRAMDRRFQELNEIMLMKNLIYKADVKSSEGVYYQSQPSGEMMLGEIGANNVKAKILAIVLDQILIQLEGETEQKADMRAEMAIRIIRIAGVFDFAGSEESIIDLHNLDVFASLKIYASFFEFMLKYFGGALEQSYGKYAAQRIIAGIESHRRLVAAINLPDVRGGRLAGATCVFQYKVHDEMADIMLRSSFLFPFDRVLESPAPLFAPGPYLWMTVYGLKPNTPYRISIPGEDLEYDYTVQALVRPRMNSRNIIKSSPEGSIQMGVIQAHQILFTELGTQCEGCQSRELMILNSDMPKNDETVYESRYNDFIVAPDYSYYYTYHVIGSSEDDISRATVFFHKHHDDLLLYLDSSP